MNPNPHAPVGAGGRCGVAVGIESISHLMARASRANAALVRGDIDGYVDLMSHAPDYTLMSPFGGTPTRGFVLSSEHKAALAGFFRFGTFEEEVVATYESSTLIVLVTIERVRAEVGGLQKQDWALRVTQVFRLDGAEWRFVHRHADPLANGVGLPQAAALARGA